MRASVQKARADRERRKRENYEHVFREIGIGSYTLKPSGG
jgi:hypothetical protein